MRDKVFFISWLIWTGIDIYDIQSIESESICTFECFLFAFHKDLKSFEKDIFIKPAFIVTFLSEAFLDSRHKSACIYIIHEYMRLFSRKANEKLPSQVLEYSMYEVQMLLRYYLLAIVAIITS